MELRVAQQHQGGGEGDGGGGDCRGGWHGVAVSGLVGEKAGRRSRPCGPRIDWTTGQVAPCQIPCQKKVLDIFPRSFFSSSPIRQLWTILPTNQVLKWLSRFSFVFREKFMVAHIWWVGEPDYWGMEWLLWEVNFGSLCSESQSGARPDAHRNFD